MRRNEIDLVRALAILFCLLGVSLVLYVFLVVPAALLSGAENEFSGGLSEAARRFISTLAVLFTIGFLVLAGSAWLAAWCLFGHHNWAVCLVVSLSTFLLGATATIVGMTGINALLLIGPYLVGLGVASTLVLLLPSVRALFRQDNGV